MIPVNEAERHLPPADDPEPPPGEPPPWGLVLVVLALVLWTLAVIVGQFLVGMW